MNPGSGGFDISSLTRQMPAIPAVHPQSGLHESHGAAFGQQLHHQSLDPHQQPPVHHPHPLLLQNMGHALLSPSSAPPGAHLPHHVSQQQSVLPPGHRSHHMSGPTDPTLHYHHSGHGVHQPTTAVPDAIHAATHQQHVSHGTHSPQPSLSSPHHTVPTAAQPVTRPMSEATNGLATSVNLSSIQSLVDLLIELPLPSESPSVLSASSRLISAEESRLISATVSTMEQQQGLSQGLVAAMRTAKQQLSQLNMTFKAKRTAASSQGQESGSAFSRSYTENAHLLSVFRQMDVLSPAVRIPPLTSESQTPDSRVQGQYWSPWSGNASESTDVPKAAVQSHPGPQPVLKPQSPFVSSPSTAQRSATTGRPVLQSNDNSNSSSSFTADVVTAAATVTPPSHSVPQHLPPTYVPQSHVGVKGPHDQQLDVHQTGLKPEPALETDGGTFYQGSEPIVMLERSEMIEKALQQYYATNGGTNRCPPSLADRVKSNKRQRSNSSHSKSEKKENKSKQRFDESEDSCSPPPAKKQAKSSSIQSKSLSSNHRSIPSSSTTPQLNNSLSSSLPATEKFESMLDELFDIDRKSVKGSKRKKKRSSSSSTDDPDSDEEDDEDKPVVTNGRHLLPALFDVTIDGNTLFQLVAMTAKLKKNHQMQSASHSKISTLLTVLTQQLSVQSAGFRNRNRGEDGTTAAASDDEDEDTNITNSSSLMHKFDSCCDICLVALYILSSKGMPSRVYLEECIEQIVAFLNTTIQQFTTIGACSGSANKKILTKMYTKWSELIGLLDELLCIRSKSLTDTLVLSTTRLALGAFFLENLTSNSSLSLYASSGGSNEIQLKALRLTATIFSQYLNHRGVILDELLQSIARLPTSKRNRVIYKVDGDDGSASISMFSALLQQLIQSLFSKSGPKEGEASDESADQDERRLKTVAQSLKQQYEAALKVAFHFLNTFLRKCCGLPVAGQAVFASDGDYRILFEGLVSDLMVTLHKPNWPAAQLLTQVLVKILITNITTTTQKGGKASGGNSGSAQAQLNLKLASLDHLGTICSRFAKELSDVDGVKNEVKTSLNIILTGGGNGGRRNGAVDHDAEDDGEDSDDKSKRRKKKKRRSSRNVLDFLQNDGRMLKEIWKHLIRFCDEERMTEQKNLLASIWLKEMERDMEAQSSIQKEEDGESNGLVSLTHQEQLETKVRAFMKLYATAANPNLEEDEYHVIDSRTSELIIRYLDISQSTTVKLFDSALGHIIAALSGTSNTTMRSRSMKSLSNILNHAKKENATALLARSDLQRAMKAALLDSSTSVREATIDLIGKFILSAHSEELVDNYFDIISDRVLDTGVSVRKRVIKILRDICLSYPSYRKVPDICAKIIKRVNDDGEGIRKLVTETFTSMWFKEEDERQSVLLKVASINHVVATVLTDRIGTEWLQQLLQNLFVAQNDSNKKKTITEIAQEEEDECKSSQSAQQLQQVTNASSQIIEVLISEILCSDNGQANSTQRKSDILSAMTTIWLFSKVCPSLLLNHISTLHPFLSTKCATQLDIMVLSKVVQIIELVLPKLSNPSESLLAKIEEDLTKNILQNNATVVGTCVSCLSAVIHKHSKNHALAQDLFKRFFHVLDGYAQSQISNPEYLKHQGVRPRLLRALFTCGLFAKHFSFLEQKEQLFSVLIRFVTENQATDSCPEAKDSDVLLKALTGLGFMFERNPQFSLRTDTITIYRSMLKSTHGSPEYQEMVQCQVLKNLTNYLSDEFNSEMNNTINWSKEDLKSMSSEDGDSNSLQSTIIQCYLADVLRCTLSPIINVRRAAVNVIHIIHNGGHVHPLQLVPYLIAMSSDDDVTIRSRADHVLNEIERKYHGYVSMKSKIGVHLSYQLHSHSGRRGFRIENINQSVPTSAPTPATASAVEKHVTGRLATLYAVVANNRQSRRAFVTGLLKYFDMMDGCGSSAGFNDVMTSISIGSDSAEGDQAPLQQFVCDNIAWLPYSLWDEPLYILTQLELNLSILASNVQSQFKGVLNLSEDDEDALDAKDDVKHPDGEDDENSRTDSEDTTAESPPPPVDADRQQDSHPTADSSFVSDLQSYIAKPIPPLAAVVDLVKVLRAYYILLWCKHVVRDLYAINDLKVQDYSPNENQKVWDKQVHRKVIDIRSVDKLMSYPTVTLDLEKSNDELRDRVIAEYKRFRDVQISGFDLFADQSAPRLKATGQQA